MPFLRYAVIGVGSMGKNHARVAHEMEEIELVGVADLRADTAELIGKLYGCPAYTDITKLLEECKPNAISVCVPTILHAKVAQECIKRNIHVLLEKPIAATVAEGELLQKSAKINDVKLLIGHIERFNPVVTKVKEILAKGEIGKVVSIMARRVGVFPPQIKDANIAVDLAIHDIDIVNYLLGELPISVVVDKRRNHIELREDSVDFFLHYPTASAYIQANWITPVKIRKLNITGTDGYLEMDYINQKIQFYKSNYEKYREKPGQVNGFSDYVLKYMEPDIVEINIAKREPLKEEIRYFLKAIINDQPIDVSHSINALNIALQD